MSISIDKEKIILVDEILKEGLFRNKSHVFEFALTKFLNGEKNAK